MLHPISEIEIEEGRQRKEPSQSHINSLATSLRQQGQINPIIITDDGVLVAGECRLKAAQQLEWQNIEVRYMSELPQQEKEVIELEENLRRSDLSWQETAKAVYYVHRRLSAADDNWNVDSTAEHIGWTSSWVYNQLRVAKELFHEDSPVHTCSSVMAAINLLDRREERARATENEHLGKTTSSLVENLFGEEEQEGESEAEHSSDEEEQNLNSVSATSTAETGCSILCEDFEEWAKNYSGPKFDFMHVDFPYGINHHKSEQGRVNNYIPYADTPDVFWNLCEVMIEHMDNYLFRSAHIMFWFSMKYYTQLVDFFNSIPSLEVVNPHPLVWHKTSGGILPDPERGPRQSYETALLISRGDRKVAQAVSNVYSGPPSKEIHTNEKPVPMLKHFFRMFVDQHSNVFDPTTGSGSSIRAAASFKPKQALGLELEQESADLAQSALEKDIKLDNLSQGAN